jgi:hypothetical protein
MSSIMRRLARAFLVTLGLLLLLSPGEAQAQCRGGSQQNRSPQSGMSRQSSLQTAMQQAALQTALQQNALQVAMQQYALQAAYQQNPLRAAYQQNALQTALQQNAQLLALRQQQAPPPQSNVAQLRVSPPAGVGDAIPKPDNPEEIAARQLQIARELVADADTTQQQGERDRAARMRERAGQRLRELVANFPGTLAAGEARELLGTSFQSLRN